MYLVCVMGGEEHGLCSDGIVGGVCVCVCVCGERRGRAWDELGAVSNPLYAYPN